MQDANRVADDRESVKESVTETSRRLLPWAVSLLMHMGLVVLAVFLVWSTLSPPEAEPTPVYTDIRSFTPMPMPTPKDTDPRRLPERREHRSVRPDRNTPEQTARPSPLDRTQPWLGAGAPAVNASVDVVPITDGGGPTIFQPTRATRVAFVIDASGSLIDTLPFVLRELSVTIAGLDEDQRFAVVFFQGDAVGRARVIELPGGLQRATAANKQRAVDWIDPASGHVVPFGKTNPVEALRRAAALQPQVIHLLSDNITGRGVYEISQAELLTQIGGIARDRIQINTYQFIYPDPLASVPGMHGTLERIAELTRGSYRFIDARELGLIDR